MADSTSIDIAPAQAWDSIIDLKEALEQDRFVRVDPEAKSGVRLGGSWWTRFVYWLMGWNDRRWTAIAQHFGELVTELKQDGVDASIGERSVAVMDLARLLDAKISPKAGSRCYRVLRQAELDALALRYVEGEDALLTDDESRWDDEQKATWERWHTAALRWKERQSLLAYGAEAQHQERKLYSQELTARDEDRLREAFQYYDYVRYALEGDDIDDFLKWVLWYGLDAAVAIKFPQQTKRIQQCYLASRVARYGGRHLQISPDGRDLTLTMAGKQVSLLDEGQRVTFANGKVKTIQQLFDDKFAVKNRKRTSYEMTRDEGIGYFDPFDLSGLDLNDPQWYRQIPVFEELTADEIAERFQLSLAPGQFGKVMCSSREYVELDVMKTHGYLIALIPSMEEGKWIVQPWGKYAECEDWPVGVVENLKFLCDTRRAMLTCMDENQFYFQRLHNYYGKALSEEQGELMMRIIADDIEAMRQGNLTFQFGGDNCASWPLSIVQRLFGEELDPAVAKLYDSYLFEAASSTPQGRFFALLKGLDDKHIVPIATTVQVVMKLFGAGRGLAVDDGAGGKKLVSMATHPFVNDYHINNPAKLGDNILSGFLDGGVVTAGPLPS